MVEFTAEVFMVPTVPMQALAAQMAVGHRAHEILTAPSADEQALVAMALMDLRKGMNPLSIMAGYRQILDIPFATAVATVKVAQRLLI